MKVINIHKRVINQPQSKLSELFKTLASENDMMLATDKWSPMKLDKGLQIGSKGGHGKIRYTVIDYNEGTFIKFQFLNKGFNGCHQFEITDFGSQKTELKHTIEMNTEGVATVTWSLAIRWLHDAYIEDAFDKVENHFLIEKKRTNWNLWVRVLRKLLKPKS